MVNSKHINHVVVLVVFLLDSCWLLPVLKAKASQSAKGRSQTKVEQLPPGVNVGWWAEVQENINRSEYNITWQQKTNLADLESAYQAPNRMQNLRTYFTSAGIRIIQRTEKTPGWQFGMNLTGYGYAGMVKPMAEAELLASGNRIEYRRGKVIEWYVNDQKGLEQGFTLTAPPQNDSGRCKQSEIILQMTVAGDLTGRLSEGGKAVVFATPDGKDVINYGALYVKDATGKELGSQILLGEGILKLQIDSSDAVYPVTIDPVITGLSTSPDWMAESDQADASFGYSVSTAGDVNGDGFADVIVGARYYDNGHTDEGAAFVYYGNGCSGLSLNPRQRRSDDSAPIAHLGISDSNDSFRLALLGRTPFGRGKVKLQWEVKPLGVLFDGISTGESATWLDTGTSGIELNELVDGLDDGTVYHWRVRLLYHPATTPLQQYSRWLTMPWNGWQEADLRTGCGLLYDLNGDCFVNFLDFALLASEWLK